MDLKSRSVPMVPGWWVSLMPNPEHDPARRWQDLCEIGTLRLCSTCAGIPVVACPECNGSGHVLTLPVQLPPHA